MFVSKEREAMMAARVAKVAKLSRTKAVKASFILISAAAMLVGGAAAHAQQGSTLATAPTGSITDITVFQVKPERADAFMNVMRTNIAHSRTEDGNLGFDVYSASKGQGVTVYVLERWRDAAAQKQHAQQPTLIALHKAFATDLIGHPQSSVVTPVAP